MHRAGIPASITLAQGLLESNNGNSRLAVEGNNHFGIKCKKGWTGKFMYEDDDEEHECFRAYDSAYQSYIDHSEFLLRNQRYSFLFEYSRTDYKSWAHGLKKAGYATNPKYPELLIRLIERNELHKIDEMSPSDFNKKVEPKVEPIEIPVKKQEEAQDFIFNDIPATRVQTGDNIVTLAKRHDMGAWQVRRYNDLPKDYQLTPGEVLYLKPKRRKGSAPYHVVQPGETMWSISQMYGIKLKHLYKKNRLSRRGLETPESGQKLYLQEKSPKKPEAVKTEEPVVLEKEPVKVILPENPKSNQDTIKGTESPKSTPETQEVKTPDPVPVFSREPILTKEEVKDTLNIPREKTDISKAVEFHTVKAGESLFSISRQYQLSVEQIMEFNGLKDYTIHVGQELILNGAAKEKSPDIDKQQFEHTVRQGETLYAIAKMYNMSVSELKNINKLQDGSLKIGQKLKLNNTKEEDGPKVTTNSTEIIHVVEAGDTLYSLSRKYQTSVDKIKKDNQLEGNDIQVGQKLKISR